MISVEMLKAFNFDSYNEQEMTRQDDKSCLKIDNRIIELYTQPFCQHHVNRLNYRCLKMNFVNFSSQEEIASLFSHLNIDFGLLEHVIRRFTLKGKDYFHIKQKVRKNRKPSLEHFISLDSKGIFRFNHSYRYDRIYFNPLFFNENRDCLMHPDYISIDLNLHFILRKDRLIPYLSVSLPFYADLNKYYLISLDSSVSSIIVDEKEYTAETIREHFDTIFDINLFKLIRQFCDIKKESYRKMSSYDKSSYIALIEMSKC